MNKVDIHIFLKPCPFCKQSLFPVNKTHCSWLECRNEQCDFLRRSLEDIEPFDETFEPIPYTEGYHKK